MLNEIQKVEREVRERIEAAKQQAASALQQAQSSLAAERSRLEEELRAKEAAAITEAEKHAEAEAAKMLADAKGPHDRSVTPDAKAIARDILARYIH